MPMPCRVGVSVSVNDRQLPSRRFRRHCRLLVVGCCCFGWPRGTQPRTKNYSWSSGACHSVLEKPQAGPVLLRRRPRERVVRFCVFESKRGDLCCVSPVYLR